MSVIEFNPATREAVYARICLYGPGGSGKTYTGLTAMAALCAGRPFGVIDTERGRAKKYVGVNGWQFHVTEPRTFSPDSLTETLGVAAGAGLAGILIDSGSLYWSGAEGMIEQVDKLTVAAGRSDKFSSGWKDIAPIERRMWDAILSYPGHVVMTLRTKVAYVVEEKERDGKKTHAPRAVGLKPVQRDGFEYEFDLVGELDQDNNVLTVVKSDIITVPQGTVVTKPSPEFFDAIGEFCSDGVEATGLLVYREQALQDGMTLPDLRDLMATVERAGLRNAPCVDENGEPTVLGDLILTRGRQVKNAEEQAARARHHAASPAPPAAKTVNARRGQQLTPAQKDAAALKGVQMLLAAGRTEQVAALIATATDSPAREVDVSGGLDEAVRAELRLPAGRLSLLGLAKHVLAYVKDADHSVNDGVARAAAELAERGSDIAESDERLADEQGHEAAA